MRKFLYTIQLVLVGVALCVTPVFADGVTIQSADFVHCGGSVGDSKVKFASVSNVGTSDETVVAAVAGKKIRVLAFGVGNGGPAEGYGSFESGTSTNISELFSLGPGTPPAIDGTPTEVDGNENRLPGAASYGRNCFPMGCFETVAGEQLQLEVGAGTNAGVALWATVTYIECT